ncbi:hypothetical protein JKP88DRAFT_350131 [Tribonema minus]|uniref:25S rRNA (uridine-N(3))-methyltransferase BMT5-like domain-containing protein n=1 Tax=Tribonema minus TaxID=303371 RepID=A0A835YP68_9STRA|nr:hypothetical protein JKP88DRAFT_350131 [Tribonema minus]
MAHVLSPYLSRHTVCGGEVNDILILGDGNFSFSQSLCSLLRRQHQDTPPPNVVTTTLDSEEWFSALYGGGGADTLAALSAFDFCTVLHGVDATRLADAPPPPLRARRFDRVIYNFPHVNGKQNARRNRALLCDTLASVARAALRARGEACVALVTGQGGTSAEARTLDGYTQSWQAATQAAEAGLTLAAVELFSVADFPGYALACHRPHGGAFSPGAAPLLHTFVHGGAAAGGVATRDAPAYQHELHLVGAPPEDPDAVARAVRSVAGAGNVLAVRLVHTYAPPQQPLFPQHDSGGQAGSGGGGGSARSGGGSSSGGCSGGAAIANCAYEITYASRTAALSRGAADELRAAVEAQVPALLGGRALRPGKSGRGVSRAVPAHLLGFHG